MQYVPGVLEERPTRVTGTGGFRPKPQVSLYLVDRQLALVYKTGKILV